ncbi:MAG: hypothetical protein HYZ53_25350 [Planctomycetes bacterium]|nr:hypothetical protein [Planctomycetota bacterium]
MKPSRKPPANPARPAQAPVSRPAAPDAHAHGHAHPHSHSPASAPASASSAGATTQGDGFLAPGGLGRKILAPLGAALLVGAGICIGRWSLPPPAPRTADAQPPTGGAPSGSRPESGTPARPPREVKNPPLTVRGPKGIGQTGSLHPGGGAAEDGRGHSGRPSFVIDPAIAGDIKAILKALRGASESADPGNLNYAQDLVRKYVTGDVAKAREVVELLRTEKDLQVLDLLVGALSQDPQIANDPGIVDSFLALAERGDDPNLRREALLFLSSVSQASSDFVERLARVGKGDADSGVQAGAIQALAQYASTHPDQAAALGHEILDVAQSARDPMVRATAVASIPAANLGDDTLRILGGLVRQDADGTVRIAAAEVLGGVKASARAPVLGFLESAFRQEGEEAVRRSLLYNIVRAGRSDAASALERIAGVDPHLAPDVQDYLEILRSGETDPARIFQEKSERDAARQPTDVELPGPGGH